MEKNISEYQKFNYIFNEAEIKNFTGFFNTLKKINNRLLKEGYQVRDGKITPPPKAL